MHILDIVVVVCENSPLIYLDGVTNVSLMPPNKSDYLDK